MKPKKKKKYYHTIRVRYADTDQMGVVHHGRYFEWFESARTEMLRSSGLPYRQLEEEGIYLPVIEAYCRYRKSVKYDELITIVAAIGELDKAAIQIEYQIFGEEETVLRGEGYTRHCFLNRQGKVIRAPQQLMEFFNRIG